MEKKIYLNVKSYWDDEPIIKGKVVKKVSLQQFFDMLKKYTKNGKKITDTELNQIAGEHNLKWEK